jgi:protein-disulfide isomerase
MVKIMAKYGEGGKVAWVFRQFPLVQLHPDAPKIAIASECVAELEGNEAFWVFTDKLNASRKVEFTPDGNLKSVEPTNITRLAEFAVAAGADKTKFELCLNSGKFDEKIAADVEAAAKTGARGTPYSIVMVGDQQGVVNGAQPFEVVDKIVANLIAQLNGGTAQ